MTLTQAKEAVYDLVCTLRAIVARDAEQEVTGIAVPVVDAVLRAAGDLLPDDDPVRAVAPELLSVHTIESGTEIRALDALDRG